MSAVRARVRRLPLRVRLVAGFVAAMSVLLTAAGGFVYWRVEYALDRGLDTDLAQATRVIEPLVRADGTVGDRDAAAATGAGWQVVDGEGEVLDHGGPASPHRPLVRPDGGGVRTVDVGSVLPASDTPYRVRVTPLVGGAALVVAVRRDHRDEALRELLLQLALAGLGALVVASLVGDVLARSALHPVERYRRRAARIAAGDADLRLDVPPDRDDEVTRLGHTLNEMLAALQESLERERRFVNDASHELRTPLAVLQSRLQLTRRRPRTVAEHEAALDELAVDLARLVALAEQLLELGRPAEHAAPLDVVAAVTAVAGSWSVELDLPDHPVVAVIDPHALDRVLTNLLGNAVNHGLPPVSVRVGAENGFVVVEVADAGPGLPPEELAEATRRFHRAPEARSRPGAGLGLAIVDELVTAAGGELRLCHAGHHSGDHAGAPCRHDNRMTVTVLLPASPS